MHRPTPPVALTIAGTDSAGGAGLAADLRSFAAHGVHGAFAVTAVTAQNTVEVRDLHPVPTSILGSQIDAVVGDLDVTATKTGLLWGVDAVQMVASRVGGLPALVVDPVLVNRRGERIQPPEVDEHLRETLFQAAAVITPNVAEASLLSGRPIESIPDAATAAAALVDDGCTNVVVTGLLVGDQAIDVWAGPDGITELAEPRIESRNVHGTGCSFSATITAMLARGTAVADAIPEAKRWVAAAIRGAADWRLGSGQGPIDHSTPTSGMLGDHV